ncbi:MAG: hypothetical protein IPP46_06110 [Bacteroidetes bacterium]|nr:hypothetical protein [Bacteroidota bacterium]
MAVRPSPFASLYRENDAWLLCRSPGVVSHLKEAVISSSQPIKGTAQQEVPDPVADEQLKNNF